MHRLRRKLTIAVAAASVATLLAPVASPASAGPCSGRGMETLTLRDFRIEAKPVKKAFPSGGTAVLDVTVTRPAEEDPAGMGVPMDGVDPMPAENVNVGAGMMMNDVFLPGFGITDANGKAKVKISIERYAKTGTADVALYAWSVVQDTPCLRVEENGFRAYPAMFTVVPKS
jgi:hypothetical protein